jgi:hypothetical protein
MKITTIRASLLSRWLPLLLMAWSCVIAGLARQAASGAEEPDYTAMSLDELGAVKVPIVFGASKHEQKITEAPSSVSIVTQLDIQEYGYRTLADILDGVRGFYTINIRVEASGTDKVCIVVADNGVGIPQENLVRIFQHGFTTKKEGHGFGLHSGALAAKEMGGSLTVQSDGVGKGAQFTLELPAGRTVEAAA